ncbi:hypothetical protein CAMRE0001_0330 [Campylobacter rectus RM3267]|uniref:Uncharacterized protein n=1 Tax=Campylobacter rectus RM3267 TaxID=553218 RepID=B9D5Y4_CAMRE|nr:hypothetical protein CAMRE0001_0330 [Campylobacter rectus RM3267]
MFSFERLTIKLINFIFDFLGYWILDYLYDYLNLIKIKR